MSTSPARHPAAPVRRRTTTAAVTLAVVATLASCTGAQGPAGPSTSAATPTATSSVAPSPSPEPTGSAPTGTTPAAPTAAPTGGAPAPEPAGTLHPELVYAGRPDGAATYELSGLVVDVVEDGGTCTFRLRNGATDVVREAPGTADAASTTCGTVEVPADELVAGTWLATLTYQGAHGRGTSPAVEVVVP